MEVDVFDFFSGRNKQQSASPAFFERLEERQLMSAVPIANKIKVAMSTDGSGNALNQSVLTVKFSENINLVDPTGFRLFGYRILTETGTGTAQSKTTINITSVVAGADGNKVVITTDRRVRKGAHLVITDGAVTNASDSTSIGQQDVQLPKGLNKERFTLACRAFVPTQFQFFDPSLFPSASALNTTPTEPSESTVTSQLTAYLNAEVSSGFITPDQKTAALATYNDATIKSEIPAPNMRAALASLTGTVADGAIAQFTTGANATGKAFTVVDFSTEVSSAAVIAETTGNVVTKRIRTLFKTSYEGENFLALAPFLAHEAVHQDLVGADPTLPDSIHEEEFANSVETYIWAQELLQSPSVAAAHTELTTHLNADLLAMLNSGLALFPRVGEANAPINSGNAMPKSSPNAGGSAPFASFEDFITRTYTAQFLDHRYDGQLVCLAGAQQHHRRREGDQLAAHLQPVGDRHAGCQPADHHRQGCGDAGPRVASGNHQVTDITVRITEARPAICWPRFFVVRSSKD